MEIAALGIIIILIGPPGAGKTMLPNACPVFCLMTCEKLENNKNTESVAGKRKK
jgi:predicted ATPase with chaperone activity